MFILIVFKSRIIVRDSKLSINNNI